MYRGVTFAALRRGIDPADADIVARMVQDVKLVMSPDAVHVDGVDASIEIRGPQVSRAVRIVAANPAVTAEMVRRQRAWVTTRGRTEEPRGGKEVVRRGRSRWAA